MVLVADCYEAKRLQAAILSSACDGKHFSHARDGTRSGLKGDFHEVTVFEGTRHLQHASGCRNGLELSFSALAII
jgi:hypothetical protein